MEQIYLSRRNLLTLLSKLDRKAEGGVSACMIVKQDNKHAKFPQTMPLIVVAAVEDEDYYDDDRQPGAVHPIDEARIKKSTLL